MSARPALHHHVCLKDRRLRHDGTGRGVPSFPTATAEGTDRGNASVGIRERVDLEQGASQAEQAATLWQERARHLESEVVRLQELLALPAHEEEPPRRRWWRWWHR